MRIASIDIGSNAARLLVVDVVSNKDNTLDYNKVCFERLPLRLGFDVFENGRISPLKEQKIIDAMRVFQSLLSFYDVKHLKACATSAMRDAKNNHDIVKTVELQTGIKINIISGDEEALLVNENHIAENIDRARLSLCQRRRGKYRSHIFC